MRKPYLDEQWRGIWKGMMSSGEGYGRGYKRGCKREIKWTFSQELRNRESEFLQYAATLFSLILSC